MPIFEGHTSITRSSPWQHWPLSVTLWIDPRCLANARRDAEQQSVRIAKTAPLKMPSTSWCPRSDPASHPGIALKVRSAPHSGKTQLPNIVPMPGPASSLSSAICRNDVPGGSAYQPPSRNCHISAALPGRFPLRDEQQICDVFGTRPISKHNADGLPSKFVIAWLICVPAHGREFPVGSGNLVAKVALGYRSSSFPDGQCAHAFSSRLKLLFVPVHSYESQALVFYQDALEPGLSRYTALRATDSTLQPSHTS